jgi:hypothetical protein
MEPAQTTFSVVCSCPFRVFRVFHVFRGQKNDMELGCTPMHADASSF